MTDYGPTRILQNWQPEHLEEKSIKVGLIAAVKAHLGSFSCEYWTIRGPEYQSPRSNLIWHYDDPNKQFWSVGWSNVLPTEFEGGFEASSGDIILVRNLDFRHRTPPNFANSGRWYAQFHDVRPSRVTKLGKRFQ